MLHIEETSHTTSQCKFLLFLNNSVFVNELQRFVSMKENALHKNEHNAFFIVKQLDTYKFH